MLLAIDTATRVASIALYDESGVLGEESWRSANNHSVEVMPSIDRMLDRQGFSEGDLEGVAVAQGPGSFTGLRIGMSLAKGLCLALDIPIIAIPTLTVTGYAVKDPGMPILAVLQAGRSRICVGTFVYDDGIPKQVGEIALFTTDRWEPDFSDPVLMTGEINPALANRLQSRPDADRLILASPARSLRRAGFLAELAWKRLKRGETDDLDTLSPLYIHQPTSGK